MECCEMFPPAHNISPTFGPIGIWGHCTTFAACLRGRRSHYMPHMLSSALSLFWVIMMWPNPPQQIVTKPWLCDVLFQTAQGVQRGWNSPEKLYQAPDYQRPQPPSAVSPKVKSTKTYIGRVSNTSMALPCTCPGHLLPLRLPYE
eukprot:scaffold31910_cov17-Prasinocladus_malaysianus.AAC.1